MVNDYTMDEEKERKVAERFLGLGLNEFFKECYQNNVNPVQALRAIKRQVRIDDGPFCCECGGSIHPEEVCLCAGCSAKDLSGENEDEKRLSTGDLWTYDGKPDYVYLIEEPSGMHEIWPNGSRSELDRDCLGAFVSNFYPRGGFLTTSERTVMGHFSSQMKWSILTPSAERRTCRMVAVKSWFWIMGKGTKFAVLRQLESRLHQRFSGGSNMSKKEKFKHVFDQGKSCIFCGEHEGELKRKGRPYCSENPYSKLELLRQRILEPYADAIRGIEELKKKTGFNRIPGPDGGYDWIGFVRKGSLKEIQNRTNESREDVEELVADVIETVSEHMDVQGVDDGN